MTHQIGNGTVNVSINMPRAERNTFGQLACHRDQSLGRLIRDLAIAGLAREDSAAARCIRHARVEHRERHLGNQLTFQLEAA